MTRDEVRLKAMVDVLKKRISDLQALQSAPNGNSKSQDPPSLVVRNEVQTPSVTNEVKTPNVINNLPPLVTNITNDVATPEVHNHLESPVVNITNDVLPAEVHIQPMPSPVVNVGQAVVNVTNEVKTPEVNNHIAAPVVNYNPNITLNTDAVADAINHMSEMLGQLVTGIFELMERLTASSVIQPPPSHDFNLPTAEVSPKRKFRITHDDGTTSTLEEQ